MGSHEETLGRLYEAILTLRTPREVAAFLEDLLSIRELQEIARRFAVAELLAAGHTYEEVAARTGASTATISRVRRCLHHGAGGYRTVIHRLQPPSAGSAPEV